VELFKRGEVVVVPFPFSDLSDQKPRPALVLVDLNGRDLVLCQITSQSARDEAALPFTRQDFAQGHLRVDGHIRPNKLFTFERRLIRYRCGCLTPAKTKEVVERIVALLRSDP
jgi:mRNA interferase MazF